MFYTQRAGCAPVQAPENASTEYRYASAAVASDSLICSEVGREILQGRGGSAVDAAVATLFCMGVSNIHSMGIGGDLIATIYDRQTQKVCVLDAREMAPGLSRDDMFVANPNQASSGGLSIAVPGAVAGLWAMHERYGRLPWADLLQPAIDMCERGFPFTAAARRAAEITGDDVLLTNGLSELLYSNAKTKKLREKGEIIQWPKLAETMRILAQEGGKAFYSGPLAKRIVEDIGEKGGIMTADDLSRYEIKWREPVVTSLPGGCKLFAAPPPADGAVLSLMLNILRGYNFDEESVATTDNAVLSYHRVIEAMKFAFAQRQSIGDPDFTDVEKIQQQMTSLEFGESLRAKIDDSRTFTSEYYGDTPYSEVKPGTSHLSLIDEDGNAVSATATINCRFGSKVVGRQTGVLFNNSMDDFCTPNLINQYLVEPFTANYIEPYKRPISSKIPVIILKGDNTVKMVTGAAGGTYICSALLQVILRSLQLGQGLAAATDAPRLHHQLRPNHLFVEDSFPKEIIDGLKAKGHDVRKMGPRLPVAQSILVDDAEVIAVSDYRKGGKPDGY